MKKQFSCKWGTRFCILASTVILGAGTAGAQSHGGRMGATKGQTMATSHRAEAKMLIDTISEEKTEINTLTAQQKELKRRGGAQNMKIANLLGRMIADHKAAGPTMMALARKHGGNPNQARIMKPPVLGSLDKMLQADMKDHMAAIKTSDMRRDKSSDPAVKAAMQKRAGIASKHMEWMKPYMKPGMHMKH